MDTPPKKVSDDFRLILLQAILLLLAGLWLLSSIFLSSQSGDLTLYFLTSRDLLQGKIPYRDFSLEYPPLALVPFTLPRLMTLGQPVSLFGYATVFLLTAVLWSSLLACVLARIARLIGGPPQSRQALAWYTAFVLALSPLLPWRYDLFPALLTALALWGVLARRPGLGGLALGAGVAAKLYPLVLFPIFGAYYWAKRDFQQLRTFTLGTVGAIVASVLPFALVRFQGFLSFVAYHEKRGLEIECLPAGWIMIARAWGWTRAGTILNFGTVHVQSPQSEIYLKALPIAMAGVFLALTWICFRKFRVQQGGGGIAAESLVTFLGAAILAFILTNKVFSPQYLIWLLPFAPFFRASQARLLVVICLCTIAIFPFFFDNLMRFEPQMVLLLNLRNLLMIVLFVWLLLPGGGEDAPWDFQSHAFQVQSDDLRRHRKKP